MISSSEYCNTPNLVVWNPCSLDILKIFENRFFIDFSIEWYIAATVGSKLKVQKRSWKNKHI